MEGRQNLMHLGVGIILIAASMLAPLVSPYLATILLVVGFFFVGWSVFGSRATPALEKSKIGRFIVRGMDRVSALTESRDEIYLARMETIETVWPSVTADEKSVLKSLVVHGHTGRCDGATWQHLLQKNLVVGTFGSGRPLHLSPEFKDFIAAKVRAEMRSESRG